MKLTLSGYLKALYFKFIDLLHFPFVKKGKYDSYHHLYDEFLSVGKSIPSPVVLEIGSRNVTGISRRNLFPNCREYVGFDILPGESVDVAGDVHKLSEYFSLEYFDIVYSISVFEHLLFPWKAVIEINKVPTRFLLSQNYPNPFNPTTTISYKIPQTEFVSLKIYDILGREAATLVNEEKPAGSYEVQFNANGLTSGIYFYQLRAGEYSETKKMLLLK